MVFTKIMQKLVIIESPGKIGTISSSLGKEYKVIASVGHVRDLPVSTLGVDVKNATMIVIFDSYRFGLSQLHQLRGRVGRNSMQSNCILISNKEAERLKIMTTTNDGFKISEEDFKLRGSGDLFGTKQSGDMTFQIADIKQDFNILVKAKEDSLEFLNIKLIDNNEYSHIRKILYNSTNLD